MLYRILCSLSNSRNKSVNSFLKFNCISRLGNSSDSSSIPGWKSGKIRCTASIHLLPFVCREGRGNRHHWCRCHGEQRLLVKALFSFRARNLDTPKCYDKHGVHPGVATIIPTWQEVDTLSDVCVVHVPNLSSSSHQILVIDGGSTDGTVEIVNRLAKGAMRPADQSLLCLKTGSLRPSCRLWPEYLNQDTQFVLEMIGHAWVAEDHIEVRVQRMLAIESEIGCKLGGLGSIVIESDLPLQRVGKWVEAALSCPLGGWANLPDSR